MIGNDLELAPRMGNCGEGGWGVPVGMGHPTLHIDELAVWGTA